MTHFPVKRTKKLSQNMQARTEGKGHRSAFCEDRKGPLTGCAVCRTSTGAAAGIFPGYWRTAEASCAVACPCAGRGRAAEPPMTVPASVPALCKIARHVHIKSRRAVDCHTDALAGPLFQCNASSLRAKTLLCMLLNLHTSLIIFFLFVWRCWYYLCSDC